VFGIPGTLQGDLRGGGVDIAEIVRRELYGNCAEVLVQALQPPGAGDGNNPRLLSKQPGQRNLGGRCAPPLRDVAE